MKNIPTAQPKQAQHKKSRPSQHDKRSRLDAPNPQRRFTTGPAFPLVGAMLALVKALSHALDPRHGFRLLIIASGMLLADDTRTASAWFQAGGVLDDWDRFYDVLMSVGRGSKDLAAVLARLLAKRFDPGPQGRILLAVDDTPTKRYGKHVEGAGVHRHPTPGPADGDWLYGHNWVCLALLLTHPFWGTIALALRSLLYVREKDVAKLAEKHGWSFRTKHELAVELALWFERTIRVLGMTCGVWVVADGAYAARPFLDPLLAKAIVVVGRLRKDAALFTLPPPRQRGQRGRPRVYGDSLSLSRRAGHSAGWSWITYQSRGQEVERKCKTFVAMSRLTARPIRVVLVQFEDQGWIPYFCTNTEIAEKEILEAAAARWAIEEHFQNVKQEWGAGEQQVRNVYSNIGCWNLNGWMATLVELVSWDEDHATLVDRGDRPWDNPRRRPSHGDRRRRVARAMLREAFPASQLPPAELENMRTYAEALSRLCA